MAIYRYLVFQEIIEILLQSINVAFCISGCIRFVRISSVKSATCFVFSESIFIVSFVQLFVPKKLTATASITKQRISKTKNAKKYLMNIERLLKAFFNLLGKEPLLVFGIPLNPSSRIYSRRPKRF